MPPKKSSTTLTQAHAPNATWTNADIEAICDHLDDCRDRGQMSENGWKPIVWTAMAQVFNNISKTPRACQTKWTQIKKDYQEVKFMREVSGFG